ncbi:MAG: maltose ABC transporter permease MalF [Acidimicrobiia bacterium]|nr:maltose ABC transporter permease MalF [Acidimicrobiia bacterium]
MAVVTKRLGGGAVPRPTVGLAVKLVLLALFNGLILYAIPRMLDNGERVMPWLVGAAAIGINYVYLSRRTVPLKYLVPGSVFLGLFIVYPLGYTVFLSLTNFGTGNILNQDQAQQQILDRATLSDAESLRYDLVLLQGPAGELALELTDPGGQVLLGTADGLIPIDQADRASYEPMPLTEAATRQEEILDFEVPTDNGVIKVNTLTTAAERTKSLIYDADRGIIVEPATGVEFEPVDGHFVSTDGTEVRALEPGWRTFIGTENFERVVTNENIRGPFLRVFAWTFAFAILTVLTTLALGLGLAMALDVEEMRGQRLYRSLLIIPYAIPSFMSALVWRGLLNEQFGAVNKLIPGGVDWLGDQWTAKFSILLVNLWLGFPYMMLVSTGALQGIPRDMTEAARVDGAGAWGVFRYVRFPLLLITLAPLLIASFAFNFNNFNLVFMLTGGGPPVLGAQTPAGHTDILISYTYRLAFEGGRGQDFGFGAAISVIIFVLVALITSYSFRHTKAFEELA